MTTQTTATSKTFNLQAIFTCDHLLVTGTDAKGTRTRCVDLNKIDGFNSQQQGLVYSILDGGIRNRPFPLTLTSEECVLLAQIGTLVTDQPKVIEVPKVPTPVQPSNGPASNHVQKTGEYLHQRLTNKTVAGGLDAIEAEVNTLQRIWKLSNATFWQIEYDIPDRLLTDCPNPCSWFRSLAIHDTKSTWIFTEEVFNSPEIQKFISDYRAAGCKVRTIKYAADMVNEVRSRAQEALDRRLRDLHTSLIQNIANADQRLQEAQEALRADGKVPTQIEEQDVWARRNNRVRQILKVAAEDFATALECAEKYDTKEEAGDLINGVRAAIRSATQAFNAQMTARGGKIAKVTI